MKLEHYSSLAIRLANKLREGLESGGYKNERLPSEQDLALQFGISRATVRNALSILEKEGIIIRRQGSGTYPNRYVLRIDARAENAYEFTELIEKSGYDPSIEILSITEKPLGSSVSEKLERSHEEVGVWVEKLFLGNGEPAIYCLDVFPRDIISTKTYPSDELKKPIFNFLETHCNQKIYYFLAELVPQTAGKEIERLLNIGYGEPLLLFKEVGFTDKNRPILKSNVYYKDEFIRFSLIRNKK